VSAPADLVLFHPPRTEIHVGDALAVMRTMPNESVHCIVTSPPYFGLRDYGHEEQLGLEQTPDEYVAKLVEIFGEARRVLRRDGTLWLVIGDTYVGGRNGGMGGSALTSGCNHEAARAAWAARKGPKHRRIEGLKPKDLIGIPWRVAFALQADGWWLRMDNIWAKPNPMPESVRDRSTRAHEYVFHFSKSETYFHDLDAAREDATCDRPSGNGFRRPERRSFHDVTTLAPRGSDAPWTPKPKRRRRSVWSISTQPYHGKHRATFPPELARVCVLSGCPRGGGSPRSLRRRGNDGARGERGRTRRGAHRDQSGDRRGSALAPRRGGP
jgi:DNA modification methylase